MSFLSLLAADNFITVNRSLIKMVGLDAAVILGEFASEANYWKERGEMQDDGFFFSTVENIEEKTSLTKYLQSTAIEKLKAAGFVEVQKRGMPAKRFIKINEDEIIKAFDHKKSKILTTSGENFLPQDVENFDHNNTKEKKTKERDITKKERKKETFDEVLDSLDLIRENPDLREAFIEYIKMRKLIKKPLTDRALKLNINEAYKLSGGNAKKMQAIVEQSIQHSWAGMYDIKEKAQNKDTYFSDLLKEMEEQNEAGNYLEGVAGLPSTFPDLLQG